MAEGCDARSPGAGEAYPNKQPSAVGMLQVSPTKDQSTGPQSGYSPQGKKDDHEGYGKM